MPSNPGTGFHSSRCMLSVIACILLASCAGRAVVLPPKVIEIPTPVEQPAACQRLRAVDLPAGSTAQDVIEAQHRAILEYEAQIKECARP